jgi:hypothetical protein
MLGYLGERYLCLMEMHGQGGRNRKRSAYVARIPMRMGVEMSLYYKLAALPASPQLPALPSLRPCGAGRVATLRALAADCLST